MPEQPFTPATTLHRLRALRATRLIASASLVLLPTLGALGPHTPAHAAGDAGTFTLATEGAAADIDPANDQLASSNMIQRNLDEQLVAFDGSSITRFKPALATSWGSNKDMSVWTFHLRHGVKFHTGHALTATDVQYSLARTITLQLASSYLLSRFLTKPWQQIKVVDPYTVEFDLGKPQPFLLPAVANEYVSAIIDSTELKKHAVKNDYGHAWAADHDLGTGPYVLQSWQHGQQVTLAQFPGYWGGWSGSHFSKIVIQTVPETATRRQLVERGQADLTFGLTPQDEQALLHESGVRVDSHFGGELQYIFMTQAGPLASPLARQAVSYAFNYDAYIRAAYGPFARRAYGPIPSILFGYDPHMFHYQTDLNKAKALLQQAGVKPGTVITFAHANFNYYNVAGAILTAQLGQIGLVVKQQSLAENAYNSVYYKTEPASQHPNLLSFSWWPDFNDPYDMALPLIYSKSAGAAGANAGYYHNATVDKLMDASVNADKQTLVRNFKTIQDITGRQDPPALWTAEPAQVTVMRNAIKGFVFNPLEIQTYSFYELYR